MPTNWTGPLLIALGSFAIVAAAVAPDDAGPGVACDEPYHVNEGKRLVTALGQEGWGFFQRANVDRNFGWKRGGTPVQAPLGQWILGATHWLFDPARDNPYVLSIASARLASAAAFALLAFLIGAWTAAREGRWAGTIAAAAVVLMPRAFGHAHLAALDTLTSLFFVAAALSFAAASRGGRTWHFALSGVVWGLAMLVRLHGLLLLPPVALWMLWRCRREWVERKAQPADRQGRTTEIGDGSRLPQTGLFGGCTGLCVTRRHSTVKGDSPIFASTKIGTVPLLGHCGRSLAAPLMAWLAAGGATLYAGWPWLWWATFSRLEQYFATGTGRPSLHVFYWGQIWADRNVPWQYPWVMFLVTVPVGLLALGFLGIWTMFRGGADIPRGETSRSRNGRQECLPHRSSEAFLLGTMLFVLVVFSCPHVPVYDGVRLFLMVFPLWAIWVGIGAQRLIEGSADHGAVFARLKIPMPSRRGARIAAVLTFVGLQGVGLIAYRPCHLSYYNLLVGGLPGAQRLGFEVSYWGEAVREPMLAEAARLSAGSPILLAPDLANYHAPAIELNSPSMRALPTPLVGGNSFGSGAARDARYAVVYHRRADLPGAAALLEGGHVLSEYAIQGVWLARLIERDAPRPRGSR